MRRANILPANTYSILYMRCQNESILNMTNSCLMSDNKLPMLLLYAVYGKISLQTVSLQIMFNVVDFCSSMDSSLRRSPSQFAKITIIFFTILFTLYRCFSSFFPLILLCSCYSICFYFTQHKQILKKILQTCHFLIYCRGQSAFTYFELIYCNILLNNSFIL